MSNSGKVEERPLGGDHQVLPRREPGYRAGVGAPGLETISFVSELKGSKQQSPA